MIFLYNIKFFYFSKKNVFYYNKTLFYLNKVLEIKLKSLNFIIFINIMLNLKI